VRLFAFHTRRVDVVVVLIGGKQLGKQTIRGGGLLLFLRDDLFVVVHVSSRRAAKARKRDERKKRFRVSECVCERGQQRIREREKALFSGLQFVSPRGELQSRVLLSTYKTRLGGKKEVKSEMLSFCLKLRTIFSR
jgi:hypothetical protein